MQAIEKNPVKTNTAAARTAVLASSDLAFRARVREALTGLRWQVREAAGGAQALAELEAGPSEALIVDSWLPDLEIGEFIGEFRRLHPGVDLITADGTGDSTGARSPRRHELLYAVQRGQDSDGAAWNSAPHIESAKPSKASWTGGSSVVGSAGAGSADAGSTTAGSMSAPSTTADSISASRRTNEAVPVRARESIAAAPVCEERAGVAMQAEAATSAVAERQQAKDATVSVEQVRLPELIGNHAAMIEVSRRIRLVAPRRTPVLIEGPSGSGKELVARALHRLSSRANRPLVVLNCAAIPEALLEAELFGHTRGAFTGAVQGRVGRIEAAHGGTLFLDEIGEMPLALQAKLLRFVECGELQRVGENEPVRVDVRVVAATHRPLARLAAEGRFRADLYYRLAVFLVRTPSLAGHREDVPLLVEHFMRRLAQDAPKKRIGACALDRLARHAWPGNVRELEHVLERASILAGDRLEITEADIEFGGEAGVEIETGIGE